MTNRKHHVKDKQINEQLSGWFHSPLRVGERAIDFVGSMVL
mgnify:CR=1 FL=1